MTAPTPMVECKICAALTVPESADAHLKWHTTLTNLPLPEGDET